MAFVRTITYTFPYKNASELEVGTDTWLRLVSAHKLLAQESEGMLDTGVWITQDTDGTLRVKSVTEWYSVEDLDSFATDPDVRLHENEITKLTTGTPTVEIFEVMG
jgi:heme-degrading monooxygenase HmoA